MHKINSKRILLNILLFLITLLFLMFYHKTFESPTRVPRFEPIEYNDGDQCYKSYAFQNKRSLDFKLKNVTEMESILKDEGTRKIFFHKTDCIHDGVIRLAPRQACAVESAAITNPDANVFLMYAGEVGWTNSTKLPYIDALLSYKNIHILSLDVDKHLESYLSGSPIMGDWIKRRTIYESPHIRVHMNDLLRLATLYNFGGTVMDLDVIVVKNISGLGNNYAGLGSIEIVYTGILNLGLDNVGRDIISELMKDFQSHYASNKFNANGVWTLMRVLEERCKCTQKELRTFLFPSDRCLGFDIYPRSYFYPLNWASWLTAYEPLNSDVISQFLTNVKDAYIVHFEANLSNDKKVVLNSGCGYEVLAKQYCPRVYSQIKEDF